MVFRSGVLHQLLLLLFSLHVCADEGYWKGGIFNFDVEVPEGYNNQVYRPYVSRKGGRERGGGRVGCSGREGGLLAVQMLYVVVFNV